MENKVFEKSSWIWCENKYTKNEYGEFFEKVDYNGEKAVLRLSVCGDYTLFINGKYVACNQYADFPGYKVFDEMEISDFLEKGENRICFLVWYFGKSGNRWFTPLPGLIYEISLNEKTAYFSSESTLSRKSPAYGSGETKKISPQLGYSFFYDMTKEDNWLKADEKGFFPSVVTFQKNGFYKRPVKKLSLGQGKKGKITKTKKGYLADFGEETVGFLKFSLKSEKERKINFAYGESLDGGHVKRLLGGRDFSFDYKAKKGKNEYCNYMLRLGCRYVEIESEEEIALENAEMIPQFFEVKENRVDFENPLDEKIYGLCVNTLKLCMLEHYVDTPWREQCLYAFDSRNQMLFGYKAFENGNFDYARANLLLMSRDNREDGLLSICFPSNDDFAIPCFSLYYVIAVKEYLENSKDLSLGREVFFKVKSILQAFCGNIKDGLVCKFDGLNRWNFYDWSENAEFEAGKEHNTPDFLLNAIFVRALDSYDYICNALNEENGFGGLSEKISKKAHEKFFNEESGLYFVENKDEKPTELANAFAVLFGIAKEENAGKICEKLKNNELIPCSLSMKCFKYDAMLKNDKEKYKNAVLEEIRKTYKIMLDKGSATAWETIEGGEAFEKAGSLCHGWSAVPVYYFNLLLCQN